MFADLYRYRRYTTIRALGSHLVRIHPFLQIFTFLIPVVAQIVFWRAVFANSGPEIGGYSAGDTILYLIVLKLIMELTWAYEGVIQEDIRYGELTEHLLKPASYIKIRYFDNLGTMVTRWMNALILILVVFVFFHGDVRLASDAWVYPAGLLSVFLTFQLQYVFMLCVALLSFWTEGNPPLVEHTSRLFSGALVPLTFLPAALQRLADGLPFKYMLYFPTTVFLGKVTPSDCVSGIFMQVLWIIVLGGVSHVMWRKGVKRYVAYGG